MKNWPFILSAFFLAGAAFFSYAPIATPTIAGINAKQNNKPLRVHYLEADISQIEDARYQLDQSAIQFAAPPKKTDILGNAALKNGGQNSGATNSTDGGTKAGSETKLNNDPVFQWRLTGIVRSPTETRAILIQGNQLISVVRGNRIDDWIIQAIDNNSVIVSSGKFSKRLRLFNGEIDRLGNVARSANGSFGNDVPRSLQDFGPIKRNPAWSPESTQNQSGSSNLRNGESGITYSISRDSDHDAALSLEN